MRFQLFAGFFLMAFPLVAGDPCPRLEPGMFPENFFHPCRPEAIGAPEKEAFLRSLPDAGEVRSFNKSEQKKLAAVDTVLRLHERSGVYVVKVVDVAPATTALHGRAVLIISQPALAFLSAEELQALVAHEVGHEYVWKQFDAARGSGNRKRLRELELICDMVAAETLRRLGIPAERLLSALTRLANYNMGHIGTTLNNDAYPELATRRSAVATWQDYVSKNRR